MFCCTCNSFIYVVSLKFSCVLRISPALRWVVCACHLMMDCMATAQVERALRKAHREAEEQLRKMQARAQSHPETVRALEEAADAAGAALPAEAAAAAFLGTCAQLDVLRAQRERASVGDQCLAAAARLVCVRAAERPLHSIGRVWGLQGAGVAAGACVLGARIHLVTAAVQSRSCRASSKSAS